MAEKLVVLLVSEQTVPNVQFLKCFFENHTETVDLLFISTEKMEEKKKSHFIRSAIEYFPHHIAEIKIIEVNENSMDDLENKTVGTLNKWQHNSFVVNITGGTKLMSLATYAYFQNKTNCWMFYQPLNQSLQQLFPEYKEYEITEFLTIKEYMKAHGIIFTYDNSCVKDYGFNKTVYKKIIEPNHNLISKLVSMQNNNYFKSPDNYPLNLKNTDEEKFKKENGERIDKNKVLKLVSDFGFDT